MNNRNRMLVLSLFGVVALINLAPGLAMAAAPWENALETVVGYMTGSTAHLLAIMAVAAVGVAMLSGRIEMSTALSVIVGIAVIFGAATIVGIFGQ